MADGELALIKERICGRQSKNLDDPYEALSKIAEQLLSNVFYQTFIYPMIRVQHTNFLSQIKAANRIVASDKKVEKIYELVSKFIGLCKSEERTANS